MKNNMKIHKLQLGDKVAIISLSSGILGESFIKHELEIGIKRLKKLGLVPVIMPSTLKGINYIKEHPEKRAEDLKKAFLDKSIKMIMVSIGGDDTYKTIPYLMNDPNFIKAVKNNPKIFTGFSDTTFNHFMLNKLGLSTFYGHSFLVDICELDNEMLPYTEKYFLLYFNNNNCYEIESSPIWYLDRTDYSENSIGVPRIEIKETHGFEVLNGVGIRTGKLFGGCIDSIYDMLVGERYGEEHKIIEKYNLIPQINKFKEKILFLETSEEKVIPEKLEIMLNELKRRKILSNVRGILVGKPYNEVYYDEYKEIYKKVFKDLDTPVLYNINFGHAYPRCIIPYDSLATIDFDNKKIVINLEMFNENKKKNTLIKRK